MAGLQVKKEEKRARIIESAMRLFAQRGYESTTISDIAKEARVGKGTIYVYFTSKSDILKEIFKTIYEDFVGCIERASSHGDVEKFVEDLVEGIGEDFEVRSKLMHILQREGIYSKEKLESFREIYKRALERAYLNLDLKSDFDEFYFYVTTFLMSSFTMTRQFSKEKILELFERGLKRLLL